MCISRSFHSFVGSHAFLAEIWTTRHSSFYHATLQYPVWRMPVTWRDNQLRRNCHPISSVHFFCFRWLRTPLSHVTLLHEVKKIRCKRIIVTRKLWSSRLTRVSWCWNDFRRRNKTLNSRSTRGSRFSYYEREFQSQQNLQVSQAPVKAIRF